MSYFAYDNIIRIYLFVNNNKKFHTIDGFWTFAPLTDFGLMPSRQNYRLTDFGLLTHHGNNTDIF